MKIRHISVKNFRGIRELEWNVRSDVVCLIGPGDATKSTVLDAIYYTLGHHRFLSMNDADFYGANIGEPIVIAVTVTHPPRKLLTENAYALLQRGWSAEDGLADDPDPASEAALTIELRVDDALEPRWIVTKPGVEEKPIGWRDRAALQLFRIDDSINTHLAWRRGSALAALTSDSDEVDSTLTAAFRQARDAAFAQPHEKLHEAATAAYWHAVALGAPEGSPFRPGLEASTMMGGTRLALHQDNVPVSSAGLGTRRLVTLALQRAGISGGSVVLIDEVEHGLEPHRLLHLLQSLREAIAKSDEDVGLGQVFLTTHSAEAVAELTVEELHIVRSEDGCTTIRRTPESLTDPNGIEPQALTRAAAPALLARRVIVAEGRTELGYLRAMAHAWNLSQGIPIAHLGTTFMEGGGTHAANRAIGLARLGYKTALFVDSDKPLRPSAEVIRDAGVQIIQWADAVSIEERVAHDLPSHELKRLVQLAIMLAGDDEAVLNAIEAQLPSAHRLTGSDPLSWMTDSITLEEIRQAIGKAFKRKWFKGIDEGELIGKLVDELLAQMSESDTATKIAELKDFAYGNR